MAVTFWTNPFRLDAVVSLPFLPIMHGSLVNSPILKERIVLGDTTDSLFDNHPGSGKWSLWRQATHLPVATHFRLNHDDGRKSWVGCSIIIKTGTIWITGRTLEVPLETLRRESFAYERQKLIATCIWLLYLGELILRNVWQPFLALNAMLKARLSLNLRNF